MTMSQETITDTTRRGQEATTNALQIWADSVKKLVGSVPTPDGRVPSAAEVVDNYFDFAEHMLATQREFTKSMVAATTSVASSAATAAQDATKNAAPRKS